MLVERSSSKNGSKNIGCLVVSPPKIILIKLGSSSQIYLTVERLTKHCSKWLKIITNDIWMWRVVKGTYTKICWKWANRQPCQNFCSPANQKLKKHQESSRSWITLKPSAAQNCPKSAFFQAVYASCPFLFGSILVPKGKASSPR